jgi:hypothetical protein
MILFILIGNVLCGENLLQDVVKDGNISLLETEINIEQLCDFPKSDLRILRNTIYAKYGYQFNSADLKSHFSQFPWYAGIKTNVDNELSEIDEMNIQLIQRIEVNIPVNAEIVNQLSGRWYFYGAFPDQGINDTSKNNDDSIDIYPNGIYAYHAKRYREMDSYGLWSIKDNTFEAVPIGKHIAENQLDTMSYGARPSYGKNTNFRISIAEFDIGQFPTCAFFDYGNWIKWQ